jgi:hypothetical protein
MSERPGLSFVTRMALDPTLRMDLMERMPTVLMVLRARCRRAGTALAMVATAEVFLDMLAPLAMRWIFFELGFFFERGLIPAPVM